MSCRGGCYTFSTLLILYIDSFCKDLGQPLVPVIQLFTTWIKKKDVLQEGVIAFKKMFQLLAFKIFLKIFERSFILDQSQLCILNGLKVTACQSEGVFC